MEVAERGNIFNCTAFGVRYRNPVSAGGKVADRLGGSPCVPKIIVEWSTPGAHSGYAAGRAITHRVLDSREGVAQDRRIFQNSGTNRRAPGSNFGHRDGVGSGLQITDGPRCLAIAPQVGVIGRPAGRVYSYRTG